MKIKNETVPLEEIYSYYFDRDDRTDTNLGGKTLAFTREAIRTILLGLKKEISQHASLEILRWIDQKITVDYAEKKEEA